MNIAQRKDVIIFILIIVLAFLVGNKAVYRNNLNKINSIKSRIEEEKKKNEILKTIAALDEKLQTFQKRSLLTTEITPLLDRISGLAQDAGIKIKTYDPLPVIYGKQYIEILLKIPLSCNYHKLGQFLSLIENNREFIWVKKLQMSKPTVTSPGESSIPKIELIVSGLYLK